MSETFSCLKRIGDSSGKPKVLVLRGEEATIGRDRFPSVTFSIPQPSISRVHAVLKKVNDAWTITDKSLNGTEVNGKKLVPCTPVELHDDDVVSFGGTDDNQFRFIGKVNIRPAKRNKSGEENDSSKRVKKMQLVQDSSRASPLQETPVSHPEESHGGAVPPVVGDDASVPSSSKSEVSSPSESRTDVSVSSTSQSVLSPRPGSSRDDLLEMKRQEEERRREYEERLAAMQRQLEEKEREQAAMRTALEEERKVNTDQAKALTALRDKEANMKLEFEKCKESMEKEKGEVERKMRHELEAMVQQRETELLQQLKEKQEALLAEKQEVEGRLKQMMEAGLSEQNKQLEEELQGERARLEQVLAGKELAQRALEAQLRTQEAHNQDQSEQQELKILQTRQDLLSCFTELIETELQCAICNELFVQATSLNCSHSFCESCITEWMKRKRECPICRTSITSHTQSRIIDSYIDKMVDALSDDMKKRREEVIKARQEEKRRKADEEEAAIVGLYVYESRRGRGRGRGRGQTRGRGRGRGRGQGQGGNAGNVEAPIIVEESPARPAPVIRSPIEIEVSSNSDSDLSSDESFGGRWYLTSSSSDEGTTCSYCGEPGHTHDECPEDLDVLF